MITALIIFGLTGFLVRKNVPLRKLLIGIGLLLVFLSLVAVFASLQPNSSILEQIRLPATLFAPPGVAP